MEVLKENFFGKLGWVIYSKGSKKKFFLNDYKFVKKFLFYYNFLLMNN